MNEDLLRKLEMFGALDFSKMDIMDAASLVLKLGAFLDDIDPILKKYGKSSEHIEKNDDSIQDKFDPFFINIKLNGHE